MFCFWEILLVFYDCLFLLLLFVMHLDVKCLFIKFLRSFFIAITFELLLKSTFLVSVFFFGLSLVIVSLFRSTGFWFFKLFFYGLFIRGCWEIRWRPWIESIWGSLFLLLEKKAFELCYGLWIVRIELSDFLLCMSLKLIYNLNSKNIYCHHISNV